MNTLKLLEYSQFLRHKYLETLSKLLWEDVVKDRGASFPSLRDIYLHIVFVVDAYINYALQGNPNYPSLNYSEYDSIEKITQKNWQEILRESKRTARHSLYPLRICCSTFSRKKRIIGANL